MSSYEAFWSAILLGSLRDPILWIVSVIFAWDLERSLQKTLVFLISAGLIWGGIRVAVYMGHGEVLGSAERFWMVGVCVLMMVTLGGVIRALRLVYSGSRPEERKDKGG